LRIILTGGGTAGHVTPNLALIPALKEKGFEIHYIGTGRGIERQLATQEGISFHAISAGKLRRYFDFKNFTDLFRIGAGFFQSLSVIRKVRPAVIFSKGGFVACPVVWAAWVSRVPVVVHESDMTPGLANRLCIPFASVICYSFPETGKYYKNIRSIHTGIPVRPKLASGDKSSGRKLCGFDDKKPVLLVIGGSQGSAVLNKIVRETLKDLLVFFQVCHICGQGNTDAGLQHLKGYAQFEYLNEELPHIFAMSDIIVSRAGATTLFELLELKKPNLLIPLSSKASRGDQIENALYFQEQGFSKVIMEEDLEREIFLQDLLHLYNNRERYVQKMSACSLKSSTEKVVEAILQQARK